MVDITSLKARLARLRLGGKAPRDIRALTIDQRQEPYWDNRGKGQMSPEMQSHGEQSSAARGVSFRKKNKKLGDPRDRSARLRLGSEFEDKHPELRDPASDDLEKKRGRKKKQKKAAQDPYNEYTKNTDKRKKNNKLKRSDKKRP